MAHYVICTHCRERFDRDKEEYVETGYHRYAHAKCSLRECQKNPELPKPKIIDPTDNVTCIFCKKPLKRSSDDCVTITSNKFAHKTCAAIEEKRELTDKEKLEKYIMKLFNTDFVSPKIKKQINDFIQEYNYSYSGMLKTLVYFYEVKGGSIEKAQGGIGIIPYVYQRAHDYYYALWQAQQKNENKVIEEYVPIVKEIHIPVPQRKIKKRKLFTFLDEEEEMHGQ